MLAGSLGVVLLCCSIVGCGGASTLAGNQNTGASATTAPTHAPIGSRQQVVNAVMTYKAAKTVAFSQKYDDSALESAASGIALSAAMCILRDKSDSLENTQAYFTYQPISASERSVAISGNTATVVRDEHQVVTLHRADGTSAVSDNVYTESYYLRDDGSGWQVADYTWVTPSGLTGGAASDDQPCTSGAQATPTPSPVAALTAASQPSNTPTPSLPTINHQYDVADYTEQGVALDVIFMGDAYAHASLGTQRAGWLILQQCATSAGLKGVVVPVWDGGFGTLGYLAPQNWHPYFDGESLSDLQTKIDEKLTCNF